MQASFFLVFDRRGKSRIVKRGPPVTKAGERFVKINLSAPESLWSPAKVETVAIEASAQNSATVPLMVDLDTIKGICKGKLVARQILNERRQADTDYKCSSCDFQQYWLTTDRHWTYKTPTVKVTA